MDYRSERRLRVATRSGLCLWLAVAAAAATAQERRTGGPAATPRTAVAEAGIIESVVSATGVVEPRNRLEVKPPIGGRIEDVVVREGETVARGQVLCWMSSSERAALLDAARAQGPEAERQWTDVYKPAPVIAPMDGVLIVRGVEPGQTVTASTTLFVLADRLIVRAQVDETDIGKVRTGQVARVSLDAYPDQETDAFVEHIAYESITVNNVSIYEVDVVPRSVPEVYRSGMTASVRIVRRRHEAAALVPFQAIRRDAGGAYVMVENAGGPARRNVKVGMEDESRVEILEGLLTGERVQLADEAYTPPSAKGEARRGGLFPMPGRR